MKKSFEFLLLEARVRTADTLRDGDTTKWREYQKLVYPASMEWRKREGHAEVCRLQRLAFHGFI